MTQESNGIIIRKVVENDFDNLVTLYEDVWPDVHFNKKEKAAFVLKESKGVCYCAEKEGKLVGSRTSFFMPAYYCGRQIKCVQFADSCVHSSCRRQGLFLRLNQAFLHDFFDEQQGELVYNISVDDSRKAYEKIGWVYIKSLTGVRKYVRPFHILWLLRFDIRKLRGEIINDGNTEVFEIDEQLLQSREKLLNNKLHIRYDKDALAWRLKSKNGIKMFVVNGLGCAIYKIGYKTRGVKYLTIGEMFLYKYDKIYLNKLEKALFKKEQPDVVMCMLTVGHPLLQLYKQIGYKGGKRFSNHGVRVESDEMREICLAPNNWGMSFLDIDTF